MRKLNRILSLVTAAALTAGLLAGCGEKPADSPEETEAVPEVTQRELLTAVVAPSCLDPGYTVREDPETGELLRSDEVPALGHSFGETVTDDEGNQVQICSVCGIAEAVREVLPIPQIHLTGSLEGIGKGLTESEYVILEAASRGLEEDFSGYTRMSTQGHSSLNKSKKNYTLRLFRDEQLEDKYKMVLFAPQREHKYILKANFIDPTACRNLAAAELWGQMAATRPNLPKRLKGLANYGAVTGMPVTLWLNGEFLGLYNLNLHKDDDLYGMEDSQRCAVLIANAQTMPESLFRAEAVFEDDVSDWELEYCEPWNRDWAVESFNRLIRILMDSDDEALRLHLHSYLDVDGAIDYLIYMYVLGLTTSSAKDLVMLNYDDIWIPSVYDMETAFGLFPDGTGAYDPAYFLPEDGNSGTGSLLWDRLLQCFRPEIEARYQALRKTVLTEENLLLTVSSYRETIPAEYFAMDTALYPDMPAQLEDPWAQIGDYISARLPLLDAALLGST